MSLVLALLGALRAALRTHAYVAAIFFARRPDIANGFLFTLMKDIKPSMPRTTVSMVATTPQPRLVKLAILPQREEPFSIGNFRYKAMHYVVKVHVPGVTGAIASVLDKTPADSHVWIVGGDAPSVREVGIGAVRRWPDVADRVGQPNLAVRLDDVGDGGLERGPTGEKARTSSVFRTCREEGAALEIGEIRLCSRNRQGPRRKGLCSSIRIDRIAALEQFGIGLGASAGRHKGTPWNGTILMLSSSDRIGQSARAKKAGIALTLVKPIKQSENDDDAWLFVVPLFL